MTDSQPEAAIRRTVDVVASAIALVPLAPLMGGLALLIRRDSPGPAIFKQERVGRHGRIFVMYKFRTMCVSPVHGPAITASGDSRVTAIGARLRSSKLDELPQLLNVLKGDMSLVGPRPEVPSYVDQWDPGRRALVLSVRPGITDPTTLVLRREEELLATVANPEEHYLSTLLPQKVNSYANYVQRRTLTADLGTILRTLREVVFA